MLFEGFDDNDETALGTLWVFGSAAPTWVAGTHITYTGYGSTWSTSSNGAQMRSPTVTMDHEWLYLWLDARSLPTEYMTVGLLRSGTQVATLLFRPGLLGVEIRRGTSAGTLLATSPPGSWYPKVPDYFWCRVLIRNAGGEISVYRAGGTTPIVTFSGDTTSSASDFFDTFDLETSGGGNCKADDCVLLTDAEKTARYGGGVPRAELFVKALVPNVNDVVALTPVGSPNNWANVDERPYSTADYNEATVSLQQDTYGKAAIGVTPLSIGGVKVVSWAGRSGATFSGTATVLKSGATTVVSSTFVLATAYVYDLNETYADTDPNTAALWTTVNLDAAYFGGRMV